MRKHDVRKWLHAVLDLLPVILIPVFMIYSHRHTLTERTEVEINYKYESNEVNSLDDLIVGNLYEIDLSHFLDTSIDDDYINFSSSYTFIIYNEIMEVNTHQIIYYSDDYTSITFNQNELTLDNDNFGSPIIGITIDSSTINNIYFYVVLGEYELNVTTETPEQLFLYTDYNVIESVSVNDTNKDIMTVFIDDFNGAIDKYFNMGNVFNLNGVYEWFNINIFSGNAPTVIYSIWNIALYELVMDLLFLLYGLFMWFIDMVEHLMEKPFKSIK